MASLTDILLPSLLLIGFLGLFVFFKIRKNMITVFDYQQGVLFRRGKFVSVLGPGRYYTSKTRRIDLIDTRKQTFLVPGQEILTSEGLSLKISLAIAYTITEPRSFLLSSVSPTSEIYQYAQQALRDAIAGSTLDAIFETRATINERMKELIAPQAAALGITIASVEIRDLILPGDLKRAYSAVATAQKEGLAAIERARAEAAALRALANAARLTQDHPGLLQLRALQTLESSKGNHLTLTMLSDPAALESATS